MLKKTRSTQTAPKIIGNTTTPVADFLHRTAIGRTNIKYKKGQIIESQGDPANAVYFIEAGRIQISVVSKHGKERVIAIAEPGAFFGEGCLSGQKQNLGTATALTACRLIKLDKVTMIKALEHEQAFSAMFLSYILDRNAQIEADLVDHLFNSSEKRLARTLLMIANIGDNGAARAIPMITQEVLAARVGTTRSRISMFMNKFRKLGFIDYNGSLKVHPSLMNVIVHE